jgi:hypothetical protein
MGPFARTLVRLFLILALAWAGTALFYNFPGPDSLRPVVAIAFVLGAVVALFALRPFLRGAAVAIVAFLLVQLWIFSLEPSNARDWQPDVAELASAKLDGDLLTVRNVRNFVWRSETDFTPQWETRTYDLAKLNGLDMYVSYWGSPTIAHTIMSWDFSDGQHLAISIETRKTVDQQYSTVAGFFRQYPLYYAVADERDVIGVRTNFRGEDVYLYRLSAPVPNARALLLDYMESINGLVDDPEWYNALLDNCTTSIQRHVRDVNPRSSPFNWRLIVNGYLPELLYQRGSIDTSMPFEELKKLSYIDERAKASGLGPDFSDVIREGLPPRPPPSNPR